MRSLLITLMLSGAAPAMAQASGGAPTDVSAGDFGLGPLAQPKSLAGDALGLAPDSVQQIRSGDALASGLLTGVGPDGKLKSAVSLGFSPFAIGASVSSDAYQKHYLQRLVARSRFSLALGPAEAGQDDGSMALGFQTVLFDRGDIMLRGAARGGGNRGVLARCIDKRRPAESAQDRAAQPDVGATARPPKPDLIAAATSCVGDMDKATWNDASLGVGVVAVARAQDNRITGASRANTIFYGSFAYGFEGLGEADVLDDDMRSDCGVRFALACNAQLIFLAKYQTDAAYVLDGAPVTARTYGLGVKLVIGAPRMTGYGFYRHDRAEFAAGAKGLDEYGVGFEQRLRRGLWVGVSVSRKSDRISDPATLAKASVVWSLGDVAKLASPLLAGP